MLGVPCTADFGQRDCQHDRDDGVHVFLNRVHNKLGIVDPRGVFIPETDDINVPLIRAPDLRAKDFVGEEGITEACPRTKVARVRWLSMTMSASCEPAYLLL